MKREPKQRPTVNNTANGRTCLICISRTQWLIWIARIPWVIEISRTQWVLFSNITNSNSHAILTNPMSHRDITDSMSHIRISRIYKYSVSYLSVTNSISHSNITNSMKTPLLPSSLSQTPQNTDLKKAKWHDLTHPNYTNLMTGRNITNSTRHVNRRTPLPPSLLLVLKRRKTQISNTHT